MNDFEAAPPRTAQAVASLFLPQRGIDAVTGDLLEEYRAVKRPALGKLRAHAWYASQALGIAARVVWPPLVAIIALRILTFPLPRGWNPSLVPSPGTSILDALILVWAAYYGARRTGRAVTGVATTIVTALIGFGSFFVYAVVTSPSLLMAPIEKPFVIVIACILLAIAMAFALTAGALGAAAARWSRATAA